MTVTISFPLTLFAIACLSGCTSANADAEQAVSNRMKDPRSTEFRNIGFCGESGKSVTRGEYNSKNSYGAYEGFEPFYYDDGAVELADGRGPIFEKCLAQMEQQTKMIEAETRAIRAKNQ